MPLTRAQQREISMVYEPRRDFRRLQYWSGARDRKRDYLPNYGNVLCG